MKAGVGAWHYRPKTTLADGRPLARGPLAVRPSTSAPANLVLGLNFSPSGKNVVSGGKISQANPFYAGKGAYATQSTGGDQPTQVSNGCTFGTSAGDNLAIAVPPVLSFTTGWTLYLCGRIASAVQAYLPLGGATALNFPCVGQIGDGNWYFIYDSTGLGSQAFSVTGKFAMRMRWDPVGQNLYWIYSGISGNTETVFTSGSLNSQTFTPNFIGQRPATANGNAGNIFGAIFAVNATLLPGSPEDLALQAAMAAIDPGYVFL
jgi:hypothetical protein